MARRRAQGRLVIGAGGGGGKSGGGGGARAPIEAPDSLRSIQYARVVDLISEGECKGLVDGAKSIFLDGAPLQNADGSYNFSGVSVDWRYGTQGQSWLPGFRSAANEVAVALEVRNATPLVRTVSDPEIDAVAVTVSVASLTAQDVTTGDLVGWGVAVAVDVQSAGGGYVQRVADWIAGKTTRRYQRTYELPVASYGPGPWDIRVRRMSADDPTVNYQSRTYWETYTEINYEKLRFPNSAVIGIAVDAAQFSRVPTRAYLWDGILVQIPSNYNPATRAYAGVWDGTFLVDWTDNPAWIFYDLATHPRYGLGEFIDPAQVDKWALYEIAQYCDELVDDGFGGTEPRFTCNAYLGTRDEALRVVQNLAAIFRGMAYWGVNALVAVQDAPADAVQLFTNANVVDGAFERQGSALNTRHTVCIVSWNDPAENYRLVPEPVIDPAGVARYGWRETELALIGCTSRGQAARAGRWVLYSEQYETDIVTFHVGLDAVFVRPGQIAKVLDQHRAGLRLAGRVAAATTGSVTIDQAITIGAGTHTLTATLPDGSLESRTLSNGTGSTAVLTPATAFTAAPQVGSLWLVETATLVAEQVRVLAIAEGEGNVATITALAHDPNKFAAVEQGLVLAPRPTSILEPQPTTPENLTLSDSIRRGKGGDVVTYLTAAWDQLIPVSGEYRYEVSYRPELGNWTTLTTRDQTIDIEGVRDGVLYDVSVVAINVLERHSRPATGSRLIVGKTAPPSDVTGLAVAPGINAVIISCDPVPDPDLDRVEIRYGDAGLGDWDSATPLVNILRGETSTSAAVPSGFFRFYARAVDSSGNYSVGIASVDATVLGGGVVTILRKDNAPDWLGTTVAMVEHWTGVLTPAQTKRADEQDWETFEFCADPPAACSYELVEVDKGVDASSRLWIDQTSVLGPGETGNPAPSLTEADYRLDAGAYDGFEAWAMGSASFRYAKARINWAPAANGAVRVSKAVLVADEIQARSEQRADQPVSTVGTTFTFSAAFNLPPNIQVTLTGGSLAISARVTAKSKTQFSVVCYDSSGSAVAGVIDWKAEGV